jgi:hypothetical protein
MGDRVNETGLECSPAADEMVIVKTSTGVRVCVPMTSGTRLRKKVRGILIRPLPAGVSILTVQIGFDAPVALGVPYEREKLQRAAESLHEALGIAQPPRAVGMLMVE